MPSDGRKWKGVAMDRMALADFLSNFGDGDGSRIFPAVSTMAKKFGWSEAKAYSRLADLRELRLLENTPHYSGPQFHRTRVRQMNLDAFLAKQPAAGLQDKTPQDSKIAQDSNIQDSRIQNQDSRIHRQDSRIEGQDSNHTLETTVTGPSRSNRHNQSSATSKPAAPQTGAVTSQTQGNPRDSEKLIACLTNANESGMTSPELVERLYGYPGYPEQDRTQEFYKAQMKITQCVARLRKQGFQITLIGKDHRNRSYVLRKN